MAEPDDILAQAQAAVEQAADALARAAAALAQLDRGALPERRQRARLKPEPRVTEPQIDCLEALAAGSSLSVQQLAAYWGAPENSILYWIRTGRLRATKDGRSYRVLVSAALAFEGTLFRQRTSA
jgi:excisionase family DNA binding protein